MMHWENVNQAQFFLGTNEDTLHVWQVAAAFVSVIPMMMHKLTDGENSLKPNHVAIFGSLSPWWQFIGNSG